MDHIYLAHHGIKGQKWGIRRFQNSDGTLTEAGKKRYNEDGTRKSHRQRLEEKFMAAGNSPERAKALADSRIRGEIVVAAVGTVAVTAAVAAAVHYRNKYVLDQYIPEDTIIKRITVDDDPTHLHDRAFYATTKKRDQAKYVGMLGNLRRQQQERFYPNNPKAVNEIAIRTKAAKVASIKSGEKAYKQLMDEDPEFAKLARMAGLDKSYEKFNRRGLIDDSQISRRMQDIFYKNLHDKGYDGVIDVNDIKGGFKARAPTIFFGGQVQNGRDIIKSATYRQVPVEEMIKADARERGILEWRRFGRTLGLTLVENPLLTGITVGSAVGAVNRWVGKPVEEQRAREAAEKKRAASERRRAQNAQIKALAASSNYTVEEIAKQVGVSPSRVQRLIGGSSG